jgi:Sulfotransferase family
MTIPDYSGRDLVFIVGCPRSGTTYLQKLIASQPRIHTGWESYLFAWYLGPLLRNWGQREHSDAAPGEMRRIGLHTYMQEEEFHRVAKELIKSMIGQLPEGDIFLEKTPAHSLWIPEIMELLPDARFINIIRDARDVVASILAASKTWGKDSLTHHAFTSAKLWSKYVQAVEKGRILVPKENFLDIRYEDLQSHPVENLQALRNFLNIEWSDTEIQNAVTKNEIQQSIKTGGTQITTNKTDAPKISENDYKFAETSFVRKGKPGSWKTDLRFYQKWQVWLFARKTMARSGYPWNYPW